MTSMIYIREYLHIVWIHRRARNGKKWFAARLPIHEFAIPPHNFYNHAHFLSTVFLDLRSKSGPDSKNCGRTINSWICGLQTFFTRNARVKRTKYF
jgi:hypothetical protein